MVGWVLFCIAIAFMPVISFVSYVCGMFAAGWALTFEKRKRKDIYRIIHENGEENLTPKLFDD